MPQLRSYRCQSMVGEWGVATHDNPAVSYWEHESYVIDTPALTFMILLVQDYQRRR